MAAVLGLCVTGVTQPRADGAACAKQRTVIAAPPSCDLMHAPYRQPQPTLPLPLCTTCHTPTAIHRSHDLLLLQRHIEEGQVRQLAVVVAPHRVV